MSLSGNSASSYFDLKSCSSAYVCTESTNEYNFSTFLSVDCVMIFHIEVQAGPLAAYYKLPLNRVVLVLVIHLLFCILLGVYLLVSSVSLTFFYDAN